jgi:hypothetical protein
MRIHQHNVIVARQLLQPLLKQNVRSSLHLVNDVDLASPV